MRRLFRILVIIFQIGILFFSSEHIIADDDLYTTFEEKRVLFISSYSSSFPTYFLQIDGLSETFHKYPVVVDVEFMDSKRFFNETNLSNFQQSIEYKLSNVDYDLVITSDDNAINFVMDNRDTLFQDLPIIFFGVNNAENAKMYAQESGVTGVVEDITLDDTIDLALSLNPNATQIVGLIDKTPTGQSDLVTFNQSRENYPDIQFNTIDMSELTFDQFLHEIALLNSDSIIILFSAQRDKDDVSYEFHESLTKILDVARQPIYHVFEHGIEEGLLGGRVVSHFEQAVNAANMALSIFEGTDINDIPLLEKSPNVYLINYKVFQEYRYDEGILPEETVFSHREYSLFEQYPEYFIGGISFVIIQTLIMLFLIHSVRLRNKAKKDILKSKETLEKAYSDLENINDLLYYKSIHDELTGLYNRNYFDEQYPRIKKLDEEQEVSIILVDVNGLKLINDAFGHLKGDEALKRTAEVLLKVFRESDIFRVGGDEFAVIPYGKSQQELNVLIRELMVEISSITIAGISLSLSVGYAMVEEDKTLRELYTEAEDWMYREKLNQVPSNRSSIIDAIITTINQKDLYSEQHSKRVSEISVKIAQFLQLSDQVIGEIRTAGLLHDIGKIIVSSEILNKSTKLTKEEYEEIKKHSEIGYRILYSVASMRDIAEYVFSHHERPDGKGYPRGLKGDEISIQARIIALADAIDAMLTDRLYRTKLSKEKCYNELDKYKGTQFCQKTTNVILNNFDELYDFVSSLND